MDISNSRDFYYCSKDLISAVDSLRRESANLFDILHECEKFCDCDKQFNKVEMLSIAVAEKKKILSDLLYYESNLANL